MEHNLILHDFVPGCKTILNSFEVSGEPKMHANCEPLLLIITKLVLELRERNHIKLFFATGHKSVPGNDMANIEMPINVNGPEPKSKTA